MADTLKTWETAIDAPPVSTATPMPDQHASFDLPPSMATPTLAAAPRVGPVPVTRQARAVILSEPFCSGHQIVEEYKVTVGNYGAEPVRKVYLRLETPWLERQMGYSLDELPVLPAGDQRILKWDLRHQKIRLGRSRTAAQFLEQFDVRVDFEDLDGERWVTTLSSGGPWSAADAAEQLQAAREF
ncbi:hypothetical protein [Spirilliplanes yamanashiensis]|uniref:hypothetical protein n=1 Tax=Spirilliplanes yamanashiensis TaxID=42233 RepID=UPI002785D56B|nr:hypothetical protein [Spirilliplanes yamanashiensis]MDP9815161.1 hypothetical protein [Spirilliplanes yamanashiensis]MDP9815175.1 hypothetical protein [Spirilliplanes yamanashiensis]